MNKKQNELIKMVLTLFIISGVIGGLLGLVNYKTKDIILANSQVSSADLKIVAPNATSFQSAPLVENDSTVKEVYNLMDASGNDVGYLFKVSPNGYKGEINMLVALDKEGKITGTKILSMKETPGVGDKISKEDFSKQYTGKDIKSNFMISRTPSKDNEIAGVSGATFSSNGFNKGVNDAISYYKKVVLGDKPEEEKKFEITAESMKFDADKIEKVEGITYNDSPREVYKVLKGDKQVGFIIVGEADGYHEGVKIKSAVGLDTVNNKITQVVVVEQHETEGVGDRVASPDYTNQFSGKTFDQILNQKNIPVDFVSGATGSSEGTLFSVRDAIRTYNEKLK